MVVRSPKLVVVHHPTRRDTTCCGSCRRRRLLLLFPFHLFFAIRDFFTRGSSSFALEFTFPCLRVRLCVSRQLSQVERLPRRRRRFDDETLSWPSISPVHVAIHAKRRLMSLYPANIATVDRRPLWASQLVVLLHASTSASFTALNAKPRAFQSVNANETMSTTDSSTRPRQRSRSKLKFRVARAPTDTQNFVLGKTQGLREKSNHQCKF